MSSDDLRLILFVVGIVIVLGIYLASRARKSPDDLDAREAVEMETMDMLSGTELNPDQNLTDLPSFSSATPENLAAAGWLDGESKQAVSDDQQKKQSANPQEIVILHVQAPKPEKFVGPDLLRAFAETGLRFGELDIFHFHLGDDSDSAVLFNVASMVKPGSLNPADMEIFETPGLSLFLCLPTAESAINAFDKMLRCAEQLATSLGGEVYNERHIHLTAQGIDYIRDRLVSFDHQSKLQQKRQ